MYLIPNVSTQRLHFVANHVFVTVSVLVNLQSRGSVWAEGGWCSCLYGCVDTVRAGCDGCYAPLHLLRLCASLLFSSLIMELICRNVCEWPLTPPEECSLPASSSFSFSAPFFCQGQERRGRITALHRDCLSLFNCSSHFHHSEMRMFMRYMS